MFARLVFLVFLALSTAASPLVVRKSPVTLPIARRFNFTGGATILERDQARAKALKAMARPNPKTVNTATFPVPATNDAVSYTVDVAVGSPPTTYTLIVDTGSSNTWVGADSSKPYEPTSTSSDTGGILFLLYGSGLVLGEEYTDTIKIGDLTIEKQSIGSALIASGFDGVDGILGIGPTDLTEGTVIGAGSVPTVTDNAWNAGLLDSYEVGISFEPATSLDVTNGELTFGGVDTSKFTGSINYVPITSTSPASSYVGIDQSITYGSSGTPILDSTSGITDTGTTLILIASDALQRYQAATGAVSDSTTGLLKISAADYDNLESLFFHIGGSSYELTKNAQTWPRALNTAIGGDADSIYLVVGDIGSLSGEGLDFIDGYSFLERYYSVFNSGDNTFGIAITPFTYATTN